MKVDPAALVTEFHRVADIAGTPIPADALSVEVLTAPHRPPSSLPKGKMAVYVFLLKDECLKVGKVGRKSQARYTSQHYLPTSSNSNLAKFVLAQREVLGLEALTEATVSAWIKDNVDRYNFLMDAGCGVPMLNLLEAFLQCRLRPIYEGFESQR